MCKCFNGNKNNFIVKKKSLLVFESQIIRKRLRVLQNIIMLTDSLKMPWFPSRLIRATLLQEM